MKTSIIICMMFMLLTASFGQVSDAVGAIHELPYKGQGFALAKSNQSFLIPKLLNYQGYLTDDQGNPTNNPSLAMTFSIYDASSAGSLKWTEDQTVNVSKGIFNVTLGSITPIPDTVFTGGINRWLGMTAGGQTLSPRTRITAMGYAYTATYSDTAQYARNATGDNDWNFLISDGADTTLQMGGRWGITRAGNILYGNTDSTHVNLGVGSTTGTNGQNYRYCTVGGGSQNTASSDRAIVGGGYYNTASNAAATVSGGEGNTASGSTATVSGGRSNTASYYYATVSGGQLNAASNQCATVGGGEINAASNSHATVGGGYQNTASGNQATVGGGASNTASGFRAAVGGGDGNAVSGGLATVPGGYRASASLYGQFAHASGIFANPGDAQTSVYVLRITSIGSSGYELYLDGSSARLTLASGRVMTFDCSATLLSRHFSWS